ncbi:hypothetical protein [Mycobacterium lentiflavum]|uniref:hypothetical protein n=1 Tax=Mycobacterium lentiflavum TaxID=141349 RepID=UPI000B120277|nr:hypothetical protein [Mycobacterium lentiflavum]
MAATSTDTTTVTRGDVVLPRRRGKSKAPNFKYDGPLSVIRLELEVGDPMVLRCGAAVGGGVFGYAGRCSATPKRAAGRIGRPTTTAWLIQKRCASGWDCPAKGLRRQPRRK